MNRILEGTGKEIAEILRQTAYASTRMTIEILHQDDQINGKPAPPITVRDAAHLEELILESMEGPFHEVTEDTFKERIADIRNRFGSNT